MVAQVRPPPWLPAKSAFCIMTRASLVAGSPARRCWSRFRGGRRSGSARERCAWIWQDAFDQQVAAGHLVIVPAGNSGQPADFSLVNKALVAESVDLNGRRSDFSSEVKGSLGAVGELPMVDLNEVGPTVAVGIGTSFAAAALAAIAVESVARQPKLRGIALRDALIRAAAQPVDTKNPPVARVVIPR
jgi:hypothetical protein